MVEVVKGAYLYASCNNMYLFSLHLFFIYNFFHIRKCEIFLYSLESKPSFCFSPLQGLNDPEEFVVHKALGTLTSLTELSLVQKPLLYDFVKDVVPLLAHPVRLPLF